MDKEHEEKIRKSFTHDRALDEFFLAEQYEDEQKWQQAYDKYDLALYLFKKSEMSVDRIEKCEAKLMELEDKMDE
jgi:hypothetical protein